MYCIRCFTPAKFNDKEWRHDAKFVGQDTFCDDYGYPIKVITEEQKKIFEVEAKLDGNLSSAVLNRLRRFGFI